MTHLEIKKNNISYNLELASTWNELTREQLLYISERWLEWKEFFKYNESIQKVKALLFLKLINNKSAKEIKHICDLLSEYDHEGNEVNLLAFTDFLFSKNNLTTNLLPSIKITWFKKLYGPADKLDNITLNELSYAIDYYNAYNKYKQEKYLNLLVCILYRQSAPGGDKRGDIREPLNLNTADRYLKQVSKLPDSIKQAIYIFFNGCLSHWQNKYPLVFNSGSPKSSSGNPDSSFIDLVLSMSGGKFGTFEQTKEQNASLVLKELQTIRASKPTQNK